MTERERQAREAFEDLLRVYLAMPDAWYGKLVLNISAEGQVNPSLELGLPKKRRSA